MEKLRDEDVRNRLATAEGWALHEGAIARQFTFPGFPEALAFVVRLGFAAEAADHHPDILVNYKRVTLTYLTHSEGGLTDKDFAGARVAAGLATAMGGA